MDTDKEITGQSSSQKDSEQEVTATAVIVPHIEVTTFILTLKEYSNTFS